jgi:hypothetical protein
MKMELLRVAGKANILRRASHVLATAAFVLLACGPASAEVSQTPLYLGGGNVPGNLTLVPSVEWPTINSVANLGAYTTNRTYLGYFDPNKCYAYAYSSTEASRHFYPVSWTIKLDHQPAVCGSVEREFHELGRDPDHRSVPLGADRRLPGEGHSQ